VDAAAGRRQQPAAAAAAAQPVPRHDGGINTPPAGDAAFVLLRKAEYGPDRGASGGQQVHRVPHLVPCAAQIASHLAI